jgi:hypothetical protein
MTAANRARLLAIPEHRRLPVYRVPTRSTRITLSGRCPECGGSSFDVEWPNDSEDRPHASVKGTVLCLMCSRTVGVLAIGGGPA